MRQNIWSLAKGNQNDLWIGTYGNGLEHLDLKSNKIKRWRGNWSDKKDIGNSYVRSVLQDKTGKIWLGFWGVGINMLDTKTGNIKRWYHSADDPKSLSYNDVWLLFQDSKDRIWIGTYGGGLNLFDSSGGGTFYKWFSDSLNNNGLCNNNILSIHEYQFNKINDETILWIGTANGLNKFIINNKTLAGTKPEVKIEKYLLQQNFITNTINSIEEDREGHLWITTNNGLIEFSPSAGILQNYTTYDGLKSNEFNPNSSCKTTDGEIFIGNINGLNVFYPDSISHSDYNPPVVLTEFQIFNEPVSVNPGSVLEKSIGSTKKIILSYDENVFSFQFASLDYNAPEMNQYSYKMEGFDKDWIKSGTRRFATYTNLDPGEYVFHVKATNSDGIWNENDTQLAILITPPYWETWWFRSFIIMTIASLLYYLYRIRLKRIIEMERLRIKIASDLHDDIGSALTRISLESELLGTKDDPDERKSATQRIGSMSREIITSMSDVVWSIDSRNDSVENLINRMKDFAFSLFSSRNIRIIFETYNLNLQKKLKVDVRQNIYLIFKEAINNSSKYSTSDHIKVEMKNEAGKFIMIIDDPETLFLPQKLTGHGLRNMQMRAERIGGKIKFINENGYKVIFTGNEL